MRLLYTHYTYFKSAFKKEYTQRLVGFLLLMLMGGQQAVAQTTLGGVNLGNLPQYLFVFTDGSGDANWQSASKGYVGDVAVYGTIADERTSGNFAYAGTIKTNDGTLSAWQSIVNNNAGQAFASTGNTTLLNDLRTSLNSAFTQINALPATAGYSSRSSASLDGLNTQNGTAETFVINITSGLSTSDPINITGDATDIYILRWDDDSNLSNGYDGQVKFSGGGGIVPLGGLKATNFINVAGDINSSGGGSTPTANGYPQGPRLNNGTGALITGADDFSGGGFFTGYWLTTGKPDNAPDANHSVRWGESSSMSNGIFVGGWYSINEKFSMTSGTSGVYVSPPTTSNCTPPSAGPDQTIACTNNQLPTSFDLVNAQAGQKWKIVSPVPAGSSISVATPSGNVTGTIVAGTYKFRLQTQSDSLNCFDEVQVVIQPCGGGGGFTDQICYTGVDEPVKVSAKQEWKINPDQTVTIRTTFAKTFVDNTYGTNAIGWPGGHSFNNLVGSDKLELSLKDGNGIEKMVLVLDYIEDGQATPSTYGTGGVTDGEGDVGLGNVADVVNVKTSLSENFNTFGCVLTTNSPPTDANYSPSASCPNWIFDVWYEVTVKLSAFGAAGFGSPSIVEVHASPSKTGSNTEEVIPGPCPVVCVNPPNAGTNQTLGCNANNQPPTGFDLVDAAAGQKWKIKSVPAGANITVATPSGNVTGTIVSGNYTFRLQTQSDSLNCFDEVSVIVQCGPGGGDEICYVSPTKPSQVSAKQEWTINPDQTVTIKTTFAKTFVDNTYGNTAIGWPGGHTFGNLVGSDKLELSLQDKNGVEKMYLEIDYISGDNTAPSGFRTEGVTDVKTGNETDVVSARTSLSENLNTLGCPSFTTNSPPTDANYTPSASCPNWIYDVWYEVTVKLSAFGAAGFGQPVIAEVHASPSKTGNNTEEVVPGPCPVATATGGSACVGGTITLQGTAAPNGATFKWTGPNGYTSTQLSPVLSNLTAANAGIYTLTVTFNQISDTDTAKVTVFPKPNAGIDKSLACADPTTGTLQTTTTLTGFSPAGGIWSVQSGNPANAAVTNAGAVSGMTVAGTYRFIYSVSGCTDTVAVTVQPCLGCVKPNAGQDQSICEPMATATLTGFTPSGGTWSAQAGNPAGATVTNAGAVSGMTANGTYRFIYSVQQGGQTCTDTVNIVRKPKPNAGPDQTVCAPVSSISLAGFTPAGGTWSTAAGNPAAATVTNAGAVTGMTTNGTYRFIYTVDGCADTVAVTRNPKPDAGPDQNICEPQSTTTLNGFSPAGGSWSAQTGNPSTATVTNAGAVVGMNANGTYRFIYSLNGCADTVTVIRTPKPNAGQDQSVCEPLTATTITGFTPVGGTWTPQPGNPAAATISNVGSVSGMVANGTYRFIYTVNQGGVLCSDTVAVIRKPKPNAGPDQSVCEPISTLTLSGFSPGGGSWTAQSGNPVNATITNTGTVAGMTANGTYRFIYTVDGCADTVAIERKLKPNAGIDKSLACADPTLGTLQTTTTLTGFSPAGGSWTTQAGNPAAATVTNAGQVSGMVVAGTYRFIYSSNGCADTVAVTVQACTGCSKPDAGPDQSICEPTTTATIMGFSPAGGSWSVQFGNPANASITNAGVVTGMISNGTYRFIYSVLQGGQVCTDTVQVVRTAKPNAGNDQSLACANPATNTLTTSTTLTGFSPSGGTWMAQPGNPASATVTNAGAVSGMTVAGTYRFIYTVSGCTDTVSVVVQPCQGCVKPNAGPDAAICAPLTTAKLTAVTAGGAWSPIASPANPSAASIDASGNVSGMTAVGTYRFVYSVTSGGQTCTDTASVVRTAKPVAGPDQTLACANPATNTLTTSTTLVPSPAGGVFTQLGTTPAAATVNGNAVSGMSVAGTYQFVYTLNGCTDTVAVTVAPCQGCVKPNAGPDVAICAPTTTAKLTAVTAGGAWSPIASPANPSAASIDASGNVSGMTAVGTYRFVYSVTSGGQTCTDTASVVRNAKPVAGPDQTLACANPTTNTLTTSTTLTGFSPSGGTWLAQSGNPASATVTNAGAVSGMTVAGTYRFVYTVSGCTDTVSVVVQPCQGCVKPNAGPDVSICAPLTTAKLTAVTAGGSWSPIASPANPSAASIDASGNVSGMTAVGTYRFVYSVTSGGQTCTDTASVVRTAKPVAGPDQTLACANPATNTLTTSTTLAPSPAGGVFTQLGNQPAAATVNGNAVSGMTVAGTYQFVYTLNGCTDTVAVTVAPCQGCVKPNAGPDAAICAPTTTAKLTAVTAGGTWSAVSSPANPAAATIDGSGNVSGMTANGTYRFVYSVTSGGQTCTDTASVIRKAKPNAGPDQTLACANPTNNTLTTSTTLAPSPAGGVFTQIGTTPAAATVNGNSVSGMTVAGTYQFVYTLDGCADTVQVTVQPCQCPVITTNDSKDTLCSGYYGEFFVANYTDLGSNGIKFVMFTSPQTANTVYTGGTEVTPSSFSNGVAQWPVGLPGSQFPANNGTTPVNYYVYAILSTTPTDAQCRPFAEKIFTILPLPQFTATAQPACSYDQTFVLNVNISTAGTYTVVFARNLSTIGNGPIPSDIISTQSGVPGGAVTPFNVPIAEANGFIVFVTNQATGCSVAAPSGSPTITPKPNAGPDQTLACANPTNNTLTTSTTLSPSPSGGSYAQIGNQPATATVNGNAVSGMTVAGTYQFVYTLNGCTDTVAVTVAPCQGCVKPNAGPDVSICAPTTTAKLTAVTAGGAWSPIASPANPSAASIDASGNVSGMTAVGTYRFVYSVTSGGQTCTDTASVVRNAKPVAGPDQTLACANPTTNTLTTSTTLAPSPAGGVFAQIGTTPAAATVNGNSVSGMTVAGTYQFVYTLNGCTDTVAVTVAPCQGCVKPNAGPDVSICAPTTTAKLTAVTAGGAWSPIASPANPSAASIDASGNVSGMTAVGTYRFVYSVTSGGQTCTDTASVVRTAKPVAGPDQTLACANPATNTLTTSTTLAPSPAGGVFTQIGTTPAAATVNGNAVSGMSVAGTYQFVYTLNGCTDTVAVTVAPCQGCVKPNAGPDVSICAPTTTAKLTAVTAGGSWTPIASPANPSAASIDASGNVSGMTAVGTYRFVYSVTSGGQTCTDTASVVRNAKPVAGPDQTLACANPTTNTLTTSTTLAPSPAGGVFAQIGTTPAAATVNGNAVSGMTVAGTYRFVYTVSGCTDTVAVTVAPCQGCVKPNAGTDVSICAPTTTAKLTAVTAGGAWSPIASPANPSAASIDASGNVSGMTAVGTYRFVYSVTSGGQTCTDTASVVRNAKPVAGPDQTLACANPATNTLTTSTTLAPSPAGGVFTQIGTTPAAATVNGNSVSGMTVAGTYQFVYTLNGCTDTVAVTVAPCQGCVKPNAGPDVSICAPTTTAKLTAVTAGGAWSPIASPANPSAASIDASGNVSGMTAVGTYRFVYSVTSGGQTCTDTASVVRTAKPVAGPDQTLACANPATNTLTTSTTLTGFSPSGGTWLAQSGNPASATVTNAGAVSGMTVAGTYRFVYTVSGCTDTVSVVVQPCQGCVKPNAGTDVSICAPLTAAKLTAVTAGGTWSPIVSPANPSAASIDASGNVSGMTAVGTYRFVYSVTSGGQTCTDTASVVRNAKPVAGPDQTLACANPATNTLTTSTTLAPSPAGGVFTQLGTTPAAATVNGNSVSGMTVAGTYQFVYTLNGCTDTVAVTVAPCQGCVKPNAGTDQSICAPTTTAKLTAVTAGGSWTPIASPANPSAASIDASGNVSGMTAVGTYRFVYSVTSGGQTCTDTASVVRNAKPVAGPDQEICAPAMTTNLTGFTPANGTWSPALNNPANATVSNQGAVNGMTLNGTYLFIYTVNGCSDTVAVVRKPKPVAGPDQTVCEPVSTVNLTGFSPAGGTWSVQSGSPLGATVSNSGLVSGMSTNGTYRFIYSINGCTDTVAVIRNLKPNAGIDKSLPCANPIAGTLQTTTSLTGFAPAGGTWTVQSGNPASATVTNAGAVSGMSASGTYKFIYSLNGCADTVQVTVESCVGCTKPNAGNDQRICEPQAATTLTGFSPAGGTWSIQAGSPPGATVNTNGQVTGMTGIGTYRFIYSVVQGGQTCSDTVAVVRNAKPVVGNAEICEPATTTSVTLNQTGGTWVAVGTNPASATITPNGQVSGLTANGTYLFIYTLNGCADTSTVIRYAKPKGGPDIMDNGAVCNTIGTVNLPDAGAGESWIQLGTSPKQVAINATTGVVTGLDVIGLYQFVLANRTTNCSDTVRVQVKDCNKGSIGDYVWKDLNDNGIQNAGEPGVRGVIVQLLNGNTNAVITSDTTDASGIYGFPNLDSGNYKVKIVVSSLPDSCLITPKKDVAIGGGNDTNDSDFDPATAESPVIVINTLGTGIQKDNNTIDAGLFSPRGSIGDFVWKDLNDNGQQNAGEPGVNGVKVILWRAVGGVPVTKLDSTITAGNGAYSFANLKKDTYIVQLVLSTLPDSCQISTKPNTGNDATDSDFTPTGLSPVVSIDPALGGISKDNNTIDAGLFSPKGSVGDFVWKDLNDNGQQDAGEPGVNGVKVILWRAVGGVPVSKLDSTITAGNGAYSFTNLKKDTYIVQVVLSTLPASCVISTKPNTGNDATDSDFTPTGLSPVVSIDPALGGISKDNNTIDAGLFSPKGSIGDYVWKDLNDNGIQNAGEPGVRGVIVQLLNGNTNAVITSDTTDASGIYGFSNLDSGNYKVKIVVSSLPDSCLITPKKDVATGGGNDTNDSDFDPATAESPVIVINTLGTGIQKDNNTIDAGLFSPKGSIGDFVWKDLNDNGQQNAGEPGVNGVKVILWRAVGGVPVTKLDSTITAGNGAYSFTNLKKDTYIVQVVLSTLPDSCQISTKPNVGNDATDSDFTPTGLSPVVSIDPALGGTNKDNNTIDAGLFSPKGSIGDFVWKDLNDNGQQNVGEPGVNGVKLILWRAVGGVPTTKLDSTVTAGNGAYTFANVVKGTYIVQIVVSTLPDTCLISTKPNTGNDATDSDFSPTGLSPVVTIDPALGGVNKDNNTIDAGLYTPCIKPTIGLATPKPATCIGTVTLNDASFTVTGISGGDRYTFATTLAGLAPYATAVPLVGNSFAVSNLPNPGNPLGQTYFVRVYNGKTNCFQDLTVVIPFIDCSINCVKPVAGPDKFVCKPVTTTDLPDAAINETWTVGSTNPAVTTINPTTGVVSGLTISGIYTFILRDKTLGSTCSDTVNVFVGVLELPKQSTCFDTLTLPRVAGATYTKAAGNPASITANGFASGMVTPGTVYTFIISRGQCVDTVRVERLNCNKIYDLALDKSISKKMALLGDTITYTVRVWNEGQATVHGVEVTDALNAGVQYISSVAEIGSYSPVSKKWNFDSLTVGDTVLLVIKVKVIGQGVWFNTAEITKMTEKDNDSTPGNGTEGEDDIDRECFTVPFLICRGQGSGLQLAVPAQYTGVVWFRKVQNGTPVQVGTGNSFLANETQLGSYEYTFTSTSGTCPAEGCCPILIVVQDCCPVEVCVPFVITKKKR